jgi:large subunit ribosomal protein L22
MQLDSREFRAEARYQRVSPQKARLVLELIRGRRVAEALETVAFTRKGIAPLVEKVLRSALQNANYLSHEEGLDVDVDNLYVKRAVANEGPRMKRVRPAPMGRAFRYQRRMSHIIIALAERQRGGMAQTVGEEDVAPAAGKAAVKKALKKKLGAKRPGAKKASGAAKPGAKRPGDGKPGDGKPGAKKSGAKKAGAGNSGKSPVRKPRTTEK